MRGAYDKPVQNEKDAILPVLDILAGYDPTLRLDRPDCYNYYGDQHDCFSIPVNGVRVPFTMDTLEQYLKARNGNVDLQLKYDGVVVKGDNLEICTCLYTQREPKKRVLGVPVSHMQVPYSHVTISVAKPYPPEPRGIGYKSVVQTKQEIERHRDEMDRMQEEYERTIRPLRETFEAYEELILGLGYQREL